MPTTDSERKREGYIQHVSKLLTRRARQPGQLCCCTRIATQERRRHVAGRCWRWRGSSRRRQPRMVEVAFVVCREKQQKHAPKPCHRRANKRPLPVQSAHRSRGIRDSSIVCISIESAAPPIAPPICMIAPMPTPPSVASAATLTPPEAATRAHPLQATGATPGPLATRSRRLQLRANWRARPPSSGRC